MALMLLPPALAGLALPRVLLRFSPGATRAELAVGAPVISLLVGFGWLAMIWGLVILAPMTGGVALDIFGTAALLGAGAAGMVVAPICALAAALWITRKGRS